MPVENLFVVALIMFAGVLTQSLTGFGSGLVTMAFLPVILGIRIAAPLVSLMNLVIETVMILRYRRSFQFGAVWPMILASLCVIPLGVWAVGNLDEKIVLRILGSVMVIFSTWALFSVRLPVLKNRIWAVIAGGLGGFLGGAYNTSGPPVIMYGNCRRWLPDEFKANLTGYFILNSLFIVTNHALSEHYNQSVWQAFLVSIPAIILGLVLGFSLDKRINPTIFRKIVLVLLMIMGARYIFI
jgi:uncharacterized membrane protein YfcA